MVLAVTAAQYINIYELKIIVFGTGTNFRYLSIHEMAKALGPVKCIALPILCISHDVIQCQALEAEER